MKNIQAFIDHLPQAIILLSEDLTIKMWNKTASNLLTLSTQCHGKLICEIIDCDEFKEYFEASVAQKKYSKFEFTVQTHKLLTLVASISDYEDGIILLLDDISHNYKLEQMRKDFVANVSHELRTPLTVVKGYLETLIDFDSKDLATCKQMLNQMYLQSLRMEKIIEDLLLLSRLETHHLQPDPHEKIEINTLLELIYQDAIALSGTHNHRIKLSIETDKKIYGSRVELRSAFANLVFNAVHYTPDKGKILIRWYQDNHTLVFSVNDTGIGIDKEHLSKITERFYRIHSHTQTGKQGSGLGLAIVKHVLSRHEATLEVLSQVGKGSTFSCRFPMG